VAGHAKVKDTPLGVLFFPFIVPSSNFLIWLYRVFEVLIYFLSHFQKSMSINAQAKSYIR